jgi:hypothetical protein
MRMKGAAMRFVWFNLMPWPDLPDNFREKYRSVWVDIPNALYDPVRLVFRRRCAERCNDSRD